MNKSELDHVTKTRYENGTQESADKRSQAGGLDWSGNAYLPLHEEVFQPDTRISERPLQVGQDLPLGEAGRPTLPATTCHLI